MASPPSQSSGTMIPSLFWPLMFHPSTVPVNVPTNFRGEPVRAEVLKPFDGETVASNKKRKPAKTGPALQNFSRIALQAHVIVEVGLEKQRYHLHRSLLVHHSKYFGNALKGSWKEAQDGVITLLDVEKDVFDVFVNWLYTQSIPSTEEDWYKMANARDNTNKNTLTTQMLRLRAVAFADRFMISRFRIAVTNHFIDISCANKSAPYYATVVFAFNNLPNNSPILDLLVAKQCAFWKPTSDGEQNSDEFKLRGALPQEFLLRVMTRYGTLYPGSKEKAALSAYAYYEENYEDGNGGHLNNEDMNKD